MKQKLISGNEAMALGALLAGCKFYAGYPITPQTELSEYLAKHMKSYGGVFIQAESELAAINMVYGAAGAGMRAMTSSSGPGISLKMEGISFLAGSELPAVIVNVMRVGPGLGGIQPSQSDYFQATKGGGHGDYRMPVLTPDSVQEMFDFMFEAFELADKYRNPVMVLCDGILGQMTESIEIKERAVLPHPKPWAVNGHENKRSHNVINSLYIYPDISEKLNLRLQERYKRMQETEQRCEIINPNAEIMIVAIGTMARVAKEAIAELRSEGINVGLIRPKRVFPFPSFAFEKSARAYLIPELNAGQMIYDVMLEVNGRAPVYPLNRLGGYLITADDIKEQVVKILKSIRQGGVKNAV